MIRRVTEHEQPADAWVSPAVAEQLCDVSLARLSRAILDGDVKTLRHGGELLVHLADVDALAEARTPRH
jgi:hypothetical protein